MNVYKLKNGKTSGSYQLPIRTEMVAKMVDGEKRLKKIHYIPGSDSIFVEDYKGDEASKAVWFEDGEIRVADENWVLNELLKKHSWFGKHYVLVNEEATAEAEVNEFEILTRASNSIITEKDEFKLQAMAMIVVSLEAADWGAFKCKTELLKYAKNHSKVLLAEMAKPDYESRLIAALAFTKKIVKYNAHRTAVVWNDGKEGIIVRVAEGETGIDKLGEFLSKENETSTGVLQRIGEKTEVANVVVNDVEVVATKSEAELRAEIRAEMELEYAPKNEAATDVVKQEVPAVEAKKEAAAETSDLEKLREEYVAVLGKDLSPRFMNDADWITKKIAEHKAL
ncbi:hypothetical protein [Flavobacterium caseinilyticum]|uniref:Uncharacterized protein n=1 Tax=Flavobacterium caseinilyticum TaxID=2541732 RepID=A0A4R5AVK3_9FLAO|nr:hypothetical protein [Flavobacterium caseinilyticum]TDD77131.1 hypothetical protein E0F89_05900 [Flavobacterium caseinilyticum]